MKTIHGFHGITAYLNNNAANIATLFIDNKRKDKRLNELLTLCNKLNIVTEYMVSKDLDILADSTNHQGVVAKLIVPITVSTSSLDDILAESAHKENSIILVLDGVTDPHNLGAIIRTADCFGVDAIILPKDNSANVNSATVAKTSSGAISNLPIITVTNITRTLEKLKDHNYWIAGTTLTDKSISLFDFRFEGRLVWILGSEDKGIRRLVQENCDYLITIPMNGTTQSLNVSVASGIILSYTRLLQHTN